MRNREHEEAEYVLVGVFFVKHGPCCMHDGDHDKLIMSATWTRAISIKMCIRIA